VHTCSLYDYEEQLSSRKLASPSLVIIGKVVALHQQFAWRPNASATEEYFKPYKAKAQSEVFLH
jgi:uroporphyrin-III C-methyltransferase/precorrin-2 dehydrogenase/sirohydrochlorin ferrochelatase/uroporphyrin-III C-methyltransferase